MQQLTTVQETSKKFKIHTLMSLTLLFFGLFWLVGDIQEPSPETSAIPFAMTCVGLTWYLVNRFRIWWHHK